MVRRKVRQLRMGRIPLVGSVRREDPGLIFEQALFAHSTHVFNDLPRIHVIALQLFGFVGVVQNYDVDRAFGPPKRLPGRLRQASRVYAVEDAPSPSRNRIEKRIHFGIVTCRERRDTIRAYSKGLQCPNSMNLQVQALPDLGIKEAMRGTVSPQALRGHPERASRPVEVEASRTDYSVTRTARQQMGSIEMIGV